MKIGRKKIIISEIIPGGKSLGPSGVSTTVPGTKRMPYIDSILI